jgi:exo-beta-1,3-glucanase (GH17 family)
VFVVWTSGVGGRDRLTTRWTEDDVITFAAVAALLVGRIVAYNPRHDDPVRGVMPTARSIRADGRALRRRGFRVATTYASTPALAPVCRLLKRSGFRRVIVGVWDPRDRSEVAAAIRQRRCADGYVVGTEGLTFGRYTREELSAAMAAVRVATARPVTTRETLAAYAADPSLFLIGDWVFPTVHPYFAGLTDPEGGCAWTADRFEELRARVTPTMPVVIGETGLPTAGSPGLDEAGQATFFECLERRKVRFAYFEAYDQPWKTTAPVEPHWGLFRSDGTPKRWAREHVDGRN